MGVRSPSYQAGFYAPERGGRAAYPQLWRGCVGAWNPGLGPSGAVLRDWGGRKNHSTLTNGPAWSTSTGRQAIQFDGVNDYARTTSRYSAAANAPVAVSLWVMTNVLTNATAFFRRLFLLGLSQEFSLVINSGRISVYDGVDRVIDSSSLIIGNWHHIVGLYDGARWMLYKDGRHLGSTTAALSPIEASPVLMGVFSTLTNGQHDGQLSDIRLYNRGLSANEISLLARRSGIAYELAPRRFYSLPPSSARLRRILTGAT